ncbi:hypothetical protein [Alkalihalobacillus sp. LMS39]|uniref:hypothetical protein n=1 Tax=Alkalihalobacillus sp. LMS39 TaxID=2924032 RepID=UPI001FB2AC9D|nr:hypothetical protein [Alkalihalobacillus sp. LMS39]UOE96240.1 hypothetical protein MM271_11820 [Alkalihalobacillus sp. LMS39]
MVNENFDKFKEEQKNHKAKYPDGEEHLGEMTLKGEVKPRSMGKSVGARGRDGR